MSEQSTITKLSYNGYYILFARHQWNLVH